MVGVDLDRRVVRQRPGQLVLPPRGDHPVAHRDHGRRGHVDRRDPVVRGERGADLDRDQRVEQRHPAHPGQRPGAGLRVQVVVEQGGAEGVGAERVERGRPGGGGDGPGQHQGDGALPRRTADVARGRAQHQAADQLRVPLPEQLGEEAAHRVAGRDDPRDAQRAGDGGHVVGAVLQPEPGAARALAVVAQVEGDHPVALGQRSHHARPVQLRGQRRAVQEEDRGRGRGAGVPDHEPASAGDVQDPAPGDVREGRPTGAVHRHSPGSNGSRAPSVTRVLLRSCLRETADSDCDGGRSLPDDDVAPDRHRPRVREQLG